MAEGAAGAGAAGCEKVAQEEGRGSGGGAGDSGAAGHRVWGGLVTRGRCW